MVNVLNVAKRFLLCQRRLWCGLPKKQPEKAELSSSLTEKIKCFNVVIEVRGSEYS